MGRPSMPGKRNHRRAAEDRKCSKMSLAHTDFGTRHGEAAITYILVAGHAPFLFIKFPFLFF